MKILKEELASWRQVAAQSVALSDVGTDPVLQPRDRRVTRRAEAGQEERQTERQIADLTRVLTTYPTRELEPLLVGRINGKLLVVDGHHRLAAYERSRRSSVPVRIKEMTKALAVRLSRLVNLDGRNLSLTLGQKSEALWQHLIDITNGGRLSLVEAGTTQRELAAEFGISSKSTVGNMKDRLEEARALHDGNSVPPDDRNAYSGWPTWWYMKLHIHPIDDELTAEERHDKAIRDMAAKMAVWAERHSLAKLKAAMQLMLYEAGEEAEEFDGLGNDF